MRTVFNGHTATAAELVRLGAKINAKSSVRLTAAGLSCVHSSLRCQEGRSALMYAAGLGRTATCVELVRLGADIDKRDNVRACEGVELGLTRRCVLQGCWTALMCAAASGHTATAAELVRLGADINAKSRVRVRCSCVCGTRRRGARSALPLPGCALRVRLLSCRRSD